MVDLKSWIAFALVVLILYALERNRGGIDLVRVFLAFGAVTVLQLIVRAATYRLGLGEFVEIIGACFWAAGTYFAFWKIVGISPVRCAGYTVIILFIQLGVSYFAVSEPIVT